MVCGCSIKRINSTESLTTNDLLSTDYEKQKRQKHTCRKISLWSTLALVLFILTTFMVIWIVVPISFMLSLPFQTFMVFIPIDSPRNADFNRPDNFGLQGVHNFYLTTRDYYNITTSTSIGAWLLLPDDEINVTTSTNVTEILQNTNRDILIYFHGVLANRAKALEQYRVLRQHFMIVAIDHRGYGDSGLNVRMSETAIANDHVQIYDWVKSVNPNNDIYYWGHSLGSGLSARTLKMLKEQSNSVPKGLVLESPFTTLQDVLVNIILGKMFRWLAYFDATILQPLDQNGFHFRSSDNVQSVDCPVMILHAEDDMVVPYFLGKRLAAMAEETRRNDQGSVTFHGISSEYGFGHNDIVRHPQIGSFIEDFKNVCRNFSQTR